MHVAECLVRIQSSGTYFALVKRKGKRSKKRLIEIESDGDNRHCCQNAPKLTSAEGARLTSLWASQFEQLIWSFDEPIRASFFEFLARAMAPEDTDRPETICLCCPNVHGSIANH